MISRVVTTACVFAIAWITWSGYWTGLLLSLGALSCVLVLWLAARTGFFELEFYALHLFPRLPKYWLWLLKEIAKANFSVARIILSRRMPLQPTIMTVDASELPAVVQATLANSITLTPGSLSLDIDRGLIEVHCLTPESAEELRGGEMLRRAAKLAEH